MVEKSLGTRAAGWDDGWNIAAAAAVLVIRGGVAVAPWNRCFRIHPEGTNQPSSPCVYYT